MELDRAAAEARRLGHARLAAAVANERLYVALAEGTCAEAIARGDDAAVLDAAERARTPSLRASARAVRLRVRAAAGLCHDDEIAAAHEAMGSVPPHDESRVEVALSLRAASVAGAEATLR